MASNEAVRELKEILAKAKTFREKKVIRREEWGSLNFEEIEVEVFGILDLCEDLETMNLELVEPGNLRAAKNTIEAVVGTLTQMDQFTLDTGGKSVVDQICGRFPNETQQVRSNCISWMGYLAYRRGDVQGKVKEVESAIEKMEEERSRQEEERKEERERWERERTEEIDKIQKDGAAKDQELERILAAARQAAADIGVGGFNRRIPTGSGKSRKREQAVARSCNCRCSDNGVASDIFTMVGILHDGSWRYLMGSYRNKGGSDRTDGVRK